MGKSKPPAGMQSSRGIAAYRKTMDNGKETPPEPAAGSDRARVVRRGSPPERNPAVPDPKGFLKTTLTEAPKKADKKIKARLKPGSSKFKRAAQFMMLIGSDEASKILPRLDPEQVEAISKEIVSIKSISPEEAEAVLEEFRDLLSPSYGYSGSSAGGLEEARRLLYAAFGPERGEAVLVRAVPDAAENPFDFLNDFSGEQLALLFKNESPAACAMVFSRLTPKLSATVLANISPDKKLEIVRRIAHLKETSPEVLGRAASALRDKARHFGRDDTVREIDGKGVLAEILRHSDLTFGGRLLEELEENDPSLSREMKDRLYTLEDICGAADRPLQEKLRTMDDREIVLLIRDRSEAFTLKILYNLSSARAKQIREESEITGPVPKIETEAVAREFLAWFRQSREEGRILMLSDEDVLV